jgi:hypothetical protein
MIAAGGCGLGRSGLAQQGIGHQPALDEPLPVAREEPWHSRRGSHLVGIGQPVDEPRPAHALLQIRKRWTRWRS